jgi:hypothetical protein
MRGAARLVPWLLVAAGVALRLHEYLRNRSLWWDEAALALNVILRAYPDLARPLDYNQTAPLGFLIASHALAQSAGTTEPILRLIPLVCAVASLILFAVLAHRMLDAPAAWIATGLFAVAEPLIHYATEFKPYAVDVLVAVGTAFVTVVVLERRRRRQPLHLLAAASAAGGAIAVWFSHPSVFILAGGAGAAAYEVARERRWSVVGVIAVVCGIWLLSFAGAYVVSVREAAANRYLHDFWSARVPYEGAPTGGAFLPVPTSPAGLRRLARWSMQSAFAIFRDPGGIYFQGVAALACVVGVATLLRSRTAEALLVLLPVALTLLASALEAYPFCCRVLLFLTPLLYLAIAAGAAALMKAVAPGARVAGLTMIVLLFLVPDQPLRSLTNPIARVELRPALEYLAFERSAGDLVYLAYGTEPVWRYYAPRYGLEGEDVLLGAGSVFEPSSSAKTGRIVQDLDRLAGARRAWILLTYIPPSERRAILDRLVLMGSVRERYRDREVQVYELTT